MESKIPSGLGIAGVRYCPRVRRLVLVTTAPPSADRRRVFVRTLDEPSFQEVTLPEERLKITEFVLAPEAGSMFIAARDELGSEPFRVFEVGLESLNAEEVPPIASTTEERAWIASLIDVSVDGSRLFVGVSRMPRGPNPPDLYVAHSLCELEVKTGVLKELGELTRPWG